MTREAIALGGLALVVLLSGCVSLERSSREGMIWDDDGDGWISCAEAVRHRIAPVRRGHPAYMYVEGTDDGVKCA